MFFGDDVFPDVDNRLTRKAATSLVVDEEPSVDPGDEQKEKR